MMPPRVGTKSKSRFQDDAQTMNEDTADTQRTYARKRVAIACDVCRLRKTRCDAAKPSCSFCSESGIQCRYTGPSQDDRRSDKDSDYTRALKRLDDIQSTLDAVATAVGAGSAEFTFSATPLTRRVQLSASPASYTTTARRKPISRMPNLFVFKAAVTPHSGDSWSYDCTRDFFRHQMMVEEDVCEAIKTFDLDIDLSRPHLWRLQRSFFENILKWLPLFDHETATHHLQNVKLRDSEHISPSTCLVLLIYANGALSSDSSLYTASSCDLPGFEYYARAIKTLRQLPRSGEDLCTLQCYVLTSIYLLLAMRPLEAWKMIRQASQTCIFLLKGRTPDELADKESFHRIYWICYVLESELEVSLELPASGLRAYEEVVDLPTSHYDEEGMYNLLALSSLRRLMVEVVDTVGLRSSAANYAPGVTLELRNQIDHWYKHLPNSLHFPSDHSLLFDMRKAYLRCMYHALIAVTFWPFVPRCNDIVHDGTGDSPESVRLADEEFTQILQGADECLDAARNYLRVAEEILTQKTLVSHMILRSYFTTAMILLLVHPVALSASTSLIATRDTSSIVHAIHNLEHWDVVPFMQRPMEEMRRIAILKGILA